MTRRDRGTGADGGAIGGRPARGFAVWFVSGLVVGCVLLLVLRGTLSPRGGGDKAGTNGGDTGEATLAGAEELLDPARRDPRARPGRRAADESPHLRQAEASFAKELHREAFKQFRAAARLAPEDPRPWFGLGRIYRELDRKEEAEKVYRRALEVAPDFLPAGLELAKILCEVGRNEESNGLLAEAEAKLPNDPRILAQYARNWMRLARPAEAITALEKYNAALGKQPWGLSNIGRAYAAAGRFDEAERAYRDALTVDAYHVLGHLWLGQLLVTRGRTDEAEQVLERFRSLQELGSQERRLERALLRRPDHLVALANLALTRCQLGKFAEARVPLSRALEIQPGNAKLRDLENKIEAALREK